MSRGLLAIADMITDIGDSAKGATPHISRLIDRINFLIVLAGQRPAQRKAIKAAIAATIKPGAGK
jgi:hypothetical protein